MKCPKCGYLGFETTDRCRNCGYDFSLAPFGVPDPELVLQTAADAVDSAADFELPALKRHTESLSAGALDLDRLFGAGPATTGEPAVALSLEPEPTRPALPSADPAPAVAVAPIAPALQAEPPLAALTANPRGAPAGPEGDPADDVAPSALPFDDAPLIAAPRPAGTPLSVRRTTPEFPRGRSRTTRPVRVEAPLALGLESPAESGPTRSAPDPVAIAAQTPAIAVRLGAVAIDGTLLGAICAGVLLLTLRIAGLSTTVEDVRVLPPVPLLGFLVLLSWGYLAAFTVAGGQTIGKMVTHIKVIGDDGRSVDAAGGVLRALGSLLVPLSAGLAYVPVFFTSDRRALHDRIAGTRVVCE